MKHVHQHLTETKVMFSNDFKMDVEKQQILIPEKMEPEMFGIFASLKQLSH